MQRLSHRAICVWFGSLLILSFVLAGVGGAAAQSGSTVFRVAPSTVRVAIDSTVDVAIEVLNASNMYSTYVVLLYDPSALEVIDLNPNLNGVQSALGTFLDPGFVIRNEANNSLGRLEFAMTQLNPSTTKSGSGALVVLRLRARREGTTNLRLEKAEGGSPEGQLIGGALEAGTVQVLANVVGPTNTMIPTQNPGTPLPTMTVTEVVVGPSPTGGPPTQAATQTQSPVRATATTRSGGGNIGGGGGGGGGQAAATAAPASGGLTTGSTLPTRTPAAPAPAAVPAQAALPLASPGDTATAQVITVVITATPLPSLTPTASAPAQVAAVQATYNPAGGQATVIARSGGAGSSKPAAKGSPAANYGLWLGAGGLLLGFVLALLLRSRKKQPG